MRKTIIRILVLAVAALWLGGGCVSHRPARNGVFNENQYLRKSFLVRATNEKDDPGWLFHSQVMSVSTPNPFGTFVFGLDPSASNAIQLVRFRLTQDKMQMVDLHEISGPSPGKTEPVINVWPVTHVDLKYRINLDGETTNFYEENQEANWQDRQWVKINFARNDLSDLTALGAGYAEFVSQCADMNNASATLVPGSFMVDERNDYMEWTVNVVIPVNWVDPSCVQAYAGDTYGEEGPMANNVGRDTVTLNLKYSLARADKQNASKYKALVLDEKDPIRHKYGPLTYTKWWRDTDGQYAARSYVTRYDPEKPIVWYFMKGFPDKYKKYFTDPGGVVDKTNKIFSDIGVAARVSFKNYDEIDKTDKDRHPRAWGDVRYNELLWVDDMDIETWYSGATLPSPDPRTGETISSKIMVIARPLKDLYIQRIDAYLKSVGASLDVNADTWPDPGSCQEGDTMPIVTDTERKVHDAANSLYSKMQEYLQRPAAVFGPLGPQDFIQPQDDDFSRAYYALLPYSFFADPEANEYVVPEGGQGVYGPGSEVWTRLQDENKFKQLARSIDRGESPYDAEGKDGIKNAATFLNSWRNLTENHQALRRAGARLRPHIKLDAADAFSFESIMKKDARHCILDPNTKQPRWETKDEWVQGLQDSYYSQVLWHEFGHAVGLDHNWAGSLDKSNFPKLTDSAGNPIYEKDATGKPDTTRPKYSLYSSSVMEYNSAPDRVFWGKGDWAPHDVASIAWIYANTNDPTQNVTTRVEPSTAPSSITGQVSSTSPWKDPKGFSDDKTEIPMLYCAGQHVRYSPFCRAGDSGTRPSEIIANEIEAYEWQYQWRNFRLYRKFWDDSDYATGGPGLPGQPNNPGDIIPDLRKFISLWLFDWSGSELADSLRRIGIKNPDPHGSDQDYYFQLTNKFNAEASSANQLVAALHKAIMQQSSGERPYKTTYDKYFGDVNQQGIILDKLFAMQGWVGIWPSDNYDPNQAGYFIGSYSGVGDNSYQTAAEDAVDSMVGGQYDVYPYFRPLAVVQFAQDTHDPAFFGRLEVRDWIGGHVFTRIQDFLDFFRNVAVENNYPGCPDFASCTYDPTLPQKNIADVDHSDQYNEFTGPDNRRYIWAYVQDRNKWIVVDRDRNTASYLVIRNYTAAVIYQQDDGNFPGAAYYYQLPLKYTIDAFEEFN